MSHQKMIRYLMVGEKKVKAALSHAAQERALGKAMTLHLKKTVDGLGGSVAEVQTMTKRLEEEQKAQKQDIDDILEAMGALSKKVEDQDAINGDLADGMDGLSKQLLET